MKFNNVCNFIFGVLSVYLLCNDVYQYIFQKRKKKNLFKSFADLIDIKISDTGTKNKRKRYYCRLSRSDRDEKKCLKAICVRLRFYNLFYTYKKTHILYKKNNLTFEFSLLLYYIIILIYTTLRVYIIRKLMKNKFLMLFVKTEYLFDNLID